MQFICSGRLCNFEIDQFSSFPLSLQNSREFVPTITCIHNSSFRNPSSPPLTLLPFIYYTTRTPNYYSTSRASTQQMIMMMICLIMHRHTSDNLQWFPSNNYKPPGELQKKDNTKLANKLVERADIDLPSECIHLFNIEIALRMRY